ncbi:lipopolysaccharide biosynthesis protein [Paraeggerthella hongkongensis]|nr:polysaccharide biosynthesis protein [Paraeggerthella hongkongensis]
MSSDWRESRSMAENGVEPLSIRQNMLWNSGGSITYLACQWLITILVVRLSDGYEAAGALSLAMAVYNIFSPLAIYRMYTYQVSDVRRENSVGEYLAFRIVTSSAALLGCLVYAALTCPTSSLLAVVLYAVYKVAGLLIDVLHGLDQVNRRMDYIGKSLIIQGLFTLAAFCSVFVATSSLELALVSMTVVTVLVGVLYDYPRSSRFESMKVGISREKALHLLRYCFPIVIAAVACAAVPSIPRQFLSFSQGEAALGIYASVAAPVAIIQMGASYIYSPLLSVFSEQYAEKRAKDLAVTFCKVVLGVAAIGAICAVGFEFLGPWLLTLIFGQSIEPYTYLLIPIIMSAIVSAYVWFFNDLLVALRCFKGSFVGNILSAVVALPVTFFFVNTFGMNGVSFTMIVSYGIGAVVMALYLIALVRRGLREGSF